MLKASNAELPDNGVKKHIFSKIFKNRNHSPFLKERNSNNSVDPPKPSLLKKKSLNANALNIINEKNPTKILAIRFNNKKKSVNNEPNTDQKLNENHLEKINENLTSPQLKEQGNIIKNEENIIRRKEITITEQKSPEDITKKNSDNYDVFFNESDSKKQALLAASNIRGVFMNEHISKDEHLQKEEKKRKMKECLESQIQEKARKKDEEKRKEREYERKEEEKIKKELSELDSRFNCENPSKKTSKQYNELPQNSQIRTSFEKIEAIPDKKDQRKEVSETKEISQIKEIQETYQTKEFYQIKDISFSQTPQNEKRPESKGISFEEPEYFKKMLEANTKLKDDKSKLQEEVEKKEEIINLLINVWNSNKITPKNSQKPPSSSQKSNSFIPPKPQIRKNKLPEPKKPQSSGLNIPKEDRVFIEEKLRTIDSKIINARQKSLLLKNEKVQKLKEDYLQRVEDLNSKKSPYKITPLPEAKVYRQYNSVPPKTTDNSYQRVTSMQEIYDEDGNQIEKNEEKPARILKSSIPYKANLQMLDQARELLNEEYSDFTDINSFKIIGNYLNTSIELKEKKVIQLNLEKNLANLRFTLENPSDRSDFLEKKPMFPSIKSSIELKSRSEFMRLDFPLNNPFNIPLNNTLNTPLHNQLNNPLNNLLNKSIDDLKYTTGDSSVKKHHIGYGDFRLTPHESKRMVLPIAQENHIDEDNEFVNMENMRLIHIKNPSVDVKVDNQILVVDNNVKGNNGEDWKSEGKSLSNNDMFNPYTTATSINTINISSVSKNNRFPREIFRPNLKKKMII